MDFAGQVAYYACHQVYLSRRAAYVIAIDKSKKLKEKVHQTDLSETFFGEWNYEGKTCTLQKKRCLT